MPTDEQLVSEAQGGSADAFDKLVERYGERLFRFLLARCGSYADAEDVMQDSFINAYRYLDSYNPRWQFSTWLYRIAIRRVQKYGARHRQADEDPAELATDAPDPLEQCLLASERENLWLTAKRLLSADSYTALWLRYAEDMSVRDVARALGRPQSWVKVVLLRARRRLGRELGRETGDEGKVYGQS